MNRLTEEEIKTYLLARNGKTGVDAITEERLRSIDLDKVPVIEKPKRGIITIDGKPAFKYDAFTPKSGSMYLKPSFAGRQILMGKIGRSLHFTNGRWFSI